MVLAAHTFLGGQSVAAGNHRRGDGPPPPVDLARNGTHRRTRFGLIRASDLASCNDVSVAVFSRPRGDGACLGYRFPGEAARPWVEAHAFWFGEDQGRFVVSASAERDAIAAAANDAGIWCTVLGRTGGDMLTVDDGRPISIESIRTVHERWLPDTMGGAEEAS